jgi:hypothetical protein
MVHRLYKDNRLDGMQLALLYHRRCLPPITPLTSDYWIRSG